MRKQITTSLVIVIFFVPTVFARNILLQILSENEDGICKSMVETQGYGCEEHKVCSIPYDSYKRVV